MYYEKPFGGRIKEFWGPNVRRQTESSHGCREQVWMIRSPGGPGPAESASLHHCPEKTTVCSSLLQHYGDICKTKQEPHLIVSNWAVDLEVSCPWFLCWEKGKFEFPSCGYPVFPSALTEAVLYPVSTLDTSCWESAGLKSFVCSC